MIKTENNVIVPSNSISLRTKLKINVGTEPCQVGIPILPDKARIPTLSSSILELSRFLLCAEHIYYIYVYNKKKKKTHTQPIS